MERSWVDSPREKNDSGDIMLEDRTRGTGGAGDLPFQSPADAHLREPRAVGAEPERGIRLETPPSGRAALPTSQSNRSQTSVRLNQDGTTTNVSGGGNDPAEFAWGPFHPCFPHPNPHVPLSSPLYASTRIIRIKRDWMVAGDLAPTFSNLYPEVLDPIFPEEQFRQVISKLNRDLVDIFSPWKVRNWIDLVLGALTLWAWDDLGLSDVKRRLFALESWLDRWNVEVGAKEGVRIIPLRRTAYMTVSSKSSLVHDDMRWCFGWCLTWYSSIFKSLILIWTSIRRSRPVPTVHHCRSQCSHLRRRGTDRLVFPS